MSYQNKIRYRLEMKLGMPLWKYGPYEVDIYGNVRDELKAIGEVLLASKPDQFRQASLWDISHNNSEYIICRLAHHVGWHDVISMTHKGADKDGQSWTTKLFSRLWKPRQGF